LSIKIKYLLKSRSRSRVVVGCPGIRPVVLGIGPVVLGGRWKRNAR
jgi:hypothetical protein